MAEVQSINDHPFVQQMIKDIKILPRDPKKYPEFDKDEIVDFSSFIYALNVLGGGGDGNLTSLVHGLWKNLAIAVQNGALTEDLQTAVQELHGYLEKIGMFQDHTPQA